MYIHYCANCKAVIKYPGQETHYCPDCHTPMLFLGLTDQEWDRKSPKEKNELKQNAAAGSCVHYCIRCKAIVRARDEKEHPCPTCRSPLVSLGIDIRDWTALSQEARSERIQAAEKIVFEAQQARAHAIAERERQKISYAKAMDEIYEYDVVTIANDGGVNVELLRRTLERHAKDGWRLHTIYSNELGKNSHSTYTAVVNSTASQDVLIFERRIQNDSMR